MDERAQTLENNHNEWGEHMDLQAATLFYDLDIEVAIKTRTKQKWKTIEKCRKKRNA